MSETTEEPAELIELELPKGNTVATIKVGSPPMPENAEELIKEHGSIALTYTIYPVPTPEFDEWAKLNGIPYELTMREGQGIRVNVTKEEHLLWIKMRWT